MDRTGRIGQEMDPAGWSYSKSFVALKSSQRNTSNRRDHMPLDTARRRRWFRTRMLATEPSPSLPSSSPARSTMNNTATSTSNTAATTAASAQPLVVFWEPKIDPTDGSRSVTIRSGLEIKNTMNFPVKLLFRGVYSSTSTGGSASNFNSCSSGGLNGYPQYCIEPNERLAVTLLQSHASTICVSPVMNAATNTKSDCVI